MMELQQGSSGYGVAQFYVTDPADIEKTIKHFFDNHCDIIDRVESVTSFLVAVQKPAALSIAGNQPQVEYQFHYVIVYKIAV